MCIDDSSQIPIRQIPKQRRYPMNRIINSVIFMLVLLLVLSLLCGCSRDEGQVGTTDTGPTETNPRTPVPTIRGHEQPKKTDRRRLSRCAVFHYSFFIIQYSFFIKYIKQTPPVSRVLSRAIIYLYRTLLYCSTESSKLDSGENGLRHYSLSNLSDDVPPMRR